MKNAIPAAVALTLEVVGFSCSSPVPELSSRGTGAVGTGGGAPTSQGGSPGAAGATSMAGQSGGNAGNGSNAGSSNASSGGNASVGGNVVGGSGGSGPSGRGGSSAGGGSTGAGTSHAGGRDSESGGFAMGGHADNGGSSGRGGTRRVDSSGGAGSGGLAGGGSGSGGMSSGGGDGGGGGASGASPSPGCGKAPTLTSGSRTIQSGGKTRSFVLRIPANYDNNHPYRLIFAFHWNGGTMSDIDGGGSSGAAWSYYGLQAQANNSTIFVAPQGNGNGWANPGGADLKFVDDMVAQIEGDLCVDTTRLFAMGFSYGGGMSYEIACARAKSFRAVAVYSGAQLSGCDGDKDHIAYLGIHGVSDGTCNISGGRSLRDTFVRNNGCTAQSPPEAKAGSSTHICTTYAGCKAGYPVEWCAFDGGHTPGMVDGGGDDGAKTWTKSEVWKFFTQF